MSALETASHRMDKQDQAQVNDPALADIRQLLETAKFYATGSYEALQRSILARDFRKTTSVDQYKGLSPMNSGTPSASPLPLTQQQQQPLAVSEDDLNGSGRMTCHAVTTSRTPSMLSRMLGTIILSYNSIAVWNSRPCNHPRCLRSSSNSVHLNYLFPVWLPRLAMTFSISWDSVVGSGASLYFSLPRVVSGSSEVFKAIDTNNIPRLQRLFSDRMFFPTDVNEDGVCLLTYALYVVKSWPAAKLLLDMHPRVVHRDNHGNAPVSIASWKFYVHGHYLESNVNGLYRRIMELGDEESHSTLIHDSVIARTKITVEEALDLEPQSLDAMDNFGMTALQWAVLRNNTHATKTILAWNPKLELCDYDRRTALHRAAEFGLLDCVGMLLEAGANVNARDAWGDTPLHLATTLPDTQMLTLLLGDGNAAVMTNRYGRTALHGSVFGRFPDDEAVLHDMVGRLRNAGASIEARDIDGMTSLLVAVQQSHVAMFRTLRSHGAVIDGLEMCAKQRNVFHIAAMFSTVDMIHTLRDEHITATDPDAKDESGLTATDYFMGRATLAQSKLAEGQRQAASDEVGPFTALISESRMRYQNWARKFYLGQEISDEGMIDPHSMSASHGLMSTRSADSDEDEYYDALDW
ncbi:hypothetical protein diail_7610 [Diaporthe ilicicola]|nr:hypothetical protein diail_7610 [Diaporthe ilicicola]